MDHRMLLLNARKPFEFIVNITHFDTRPVVVSPPCPRVNTWADGYTNGAYVTAVSSYIETYPYEAESAGVDIFYWNASITQRTQQVSVSATGFSLSSNTQITSQNKCQLLYTVPGIYVVNVEVRNI